MSISTLGRALEFMRTPQDVEVRRGGDWVLGSMIGWRQEEAGSCRVMVRVTEEGADRTAWADLRDVRLPERRSSPPTESLPLLPRLPPGRGEQVITSGTRAAAPAQRPAASWTEAEPTRLMTLPGPHPVGAVAPRSGGGTGR